MHASYLQFNCNGPEQPPSMGFYQNSHLWVFGPSAIAPAPKGNTDIISRISARFKRTFYCGPAHLTTDRCTKESPENQNSGFFGSGFC